MQAFPRPSVGGNEIMWSLYKKVLVLLKYSVATQHKREDFNAFNFALVVRCADPNRPTDCIIQSLTVSAYRLWRAGFTLGKVIGSWNAL